MNVLYAKVRVVGCLQSAASSCCKCSLLSECDFWLQLQDRGHMLELIRYVGYRVHFTSKLKTRKLAIGGWNYKVNSYTRLFCYPQSLSAKWLGQLLNICKARSPSPNPRIIKNLAMLICMQCPLAHPSHATWFLSRSFHWADSSSS